jgi:hypothetical protein
MPEQHEHTPLTTPTDRLAGLNTYIDGKMRRYSLLFTVNGGAFAIAKLLGEQQAGKVLGDLSLRAVAIGAIVFTCLMWLDIYLFGQMMRSKFFGGDKGDEGGIIEEMKRFLRTDMSEEDNPLDEPIVFGPQGKFVLGALCMLLILGWSLAAFGPVGAIVALVVIAITLRLLIIHLRKRASSRQSTIDTSRVADG